MAWSLKKIDSLQAQCKVNYNLQMDFFSVEQNNNNLFLKSPLEHPIKLGTLDEELGISYLPIKSIDGQWNKRVFFKLKNGLFHGYKYGLDGRADATDSSKINGYTGTFGFFSSEITQGFFRDLFEIGRQLTKQGFCSSSLATQ